MSEPGPSPPTRCLPLDRGASPLPPEPGEDFRWARTGSDRETISRSSAPSHQVSLTMRDPIHVHFPSVPPVRWFNLALALPGLRGAGESETSRAVLSAGCGSSENPPGATAPVPRSWASRRDLRRTVGHPVQTVNTSGYHVFWPWGRTLFPSIQGSATLPLKASPSSPPFPSHPHTPVL